MSYEVVVDTGWCPLCRAECTVEVIQVAGDPGPVAVCLDCGGGVECWIDPDLLAPRARGRRRAS